MTEEDAVVSQELMKRMQRRQDAEDARRDVAAMATTLASIQERRQAETAKHLVAASKIIDKLNLIVSNQEQTSLPHAPTLEQECVAHLGILNRLSALCAPENDDVPETRRAKKDRTQKLFDLYTRTLDLLLTYTRPSVPRSEAKLAELLASPNVQALVPQDVAQAIRDELFSNHPRVVQMRS